MFALSAGLPVANSESRLYVKSAVSVCGAVSGLKAAEKSGRAGAVLFRGMTAIVDAHPVYWAVDRIFPLAL